MRIIRIRCLQIPNQEGCAASTCDDRKIATPPILHGPGRNTSIYTVEVTTTSVTVLV